MILVDGGLKDEFEVGDKVLLSVGDSFEEVAYISDVLTNRNNEEVYFVIKHPSLPHIYEGMYFSKSVLKKIK